MEKGGVISVIILIIVAVVATGAVVVYVAVYVFDDGDEFPCGMNLEVPEGWEKVDMVGNQVGYRTSKDSEEDIFMENVIVQVQDLTGLSMDLEAYTRLNFGQLESVEFLEFGEDTLGDKEAYRIVYPLSGLKFLQIWTVVGNSAYLVTYTARGEGYDKYLAVAEGVIASLEIDGDCYGVGGVDERGGEGEREGVVSDRTIEIPEDYDPTSFDREGYRAIFLYDIYDISESCSCSIPESIKWERVNEGSSYARASFYIPQGSKKEIPRIFCSNCPELEELVEVAEISLANFFVASVFLSEENNVGDIRGVFNLISSHLEENNGPCIDKEGLRIKKTNLEQYPDIKKIKDIDSSFWGGWGVEVWGATDPHIRYVDCW